MKNLIWAIVFSLTFILMGVIVVGDTIAQPLPRRPIKPEKPVEPMKPIESVKPIEPIEPKKPEKPVEPIWVLEKRKPSPEEVKAWLILHKEELKEKDKPWELRERKEVEDILRVEARDDTELEKLVKEYESIEIDGYLSYQSWKVLEPYHKFVEELEKNIVRIERLTLPEFEQFIAGLKGIKFEILKIKVLEMPTAEFLEVFSPEKFKALVVRFEPTEVERLALKILELEGYEKFTEYMSWYMEEIEWTEEYALVVKSNNDKAIREFLGISQSNPIKSLSSFFKIKGVWNIKDFKETADTRAYEVENLNPSDEIVITQPIFLIVDYAVDDYTERALNKLIDKYQDYIIAGVVGWDKNNNIDFKTDFDKRLLKARMHAEMFEQRGIPCFLTVCKVTDGSDYRWIKAYEKTGKKPYGLWVWNLQANFGIAPRKYKGYRLVVGGLLKEYFGLTDEELALRVKEIREIKKYNGVMVIEQ